MDERGWLDATPGVFRRRLLLGAQPHAGYLNVDERPGPTAARIRDMLRRFFAALLGGNYGPRRSPFAHSAHCTLGRSVAAGARCQTGRRHADARRKAL